MHTVLYQYVLSLSPYIANTLLHFNPLHKNLNVKYALSLLIAFSSVFSISAQVSCPAFTTNPGTIITCSTLDTTLRVTATGSPTFQWQVYEEDQATGNYAWNDLTNGTSRGAQWGGITTNALTISNVTDISFFNNRSIRCRATNACGTPAYSIVSRVTFNNPIQITNPPESISVCRGAPFDLWVGASGGGPLTYTWIHNGREQPERRPKYQIAAAGPANGGEYTVTLSNACGNATTSIARINIIDSTPAVIARQPTDASICEDNGAFFSVFTTGNASSYLWEYFNAVSNEWQSVPEGAFVTATTNASGSTLPTLKLTQVSSTLHGYQFRCRVTNRCNGNVTNSNTVTLSVGSHITIADSPAADMTLCSGQNHDLTVTVSNNTNGPFTYLWERDGTQISPVPPATPASTNARTSTYSITGAQNANAGLYKVTMTSPCGSYSTHFKVRIISAPTITQNLSNETICTLQDYHPYVSVSGGGPYSYTWYKNNNQISSYTSNHPSSMLRDDTYQKDDLLLDVVSETPSVAYGFRKLRKAYTGSAVRVRRNTDHTLSDIGFDQDGSFNVAAFNQFAAGGRVFVETWYDQVGTRDATQTTNANQPELVITNGNPEIIFDGTDDFLTLGTTIDALIVSNANSVRGSVFGVFRTAIATAPAGTANSPFGVPGWSGEIEGTLVGFASAGATIDRLLNPSILNTLHQHSFIRSFNATTNFTSVSIDQTTTSSNVLQFISITSTESFNIGRRDNGNHFNGRCREFILFRDALSGTSLHTVEVSQISYHNTVTGRIDVTGDLVLPSDYNYTAGVRASGTLDASALFYNQAIASGLEAFRTTGVLIRPFYPSDISEVQQWIDFTDASTMNFNGVDAATRARRIDRINNKIAAVANSNYQNTGAVASLPLFRNGRLESIGGPDGKWLTTNYALTGASWGFFFVGGYTSGGNAKRRIFDGVGSNVAFGFTSANRGSLHWNGNPNVVDRGLNEDTDMHLWSARRLTSGQLIQDWDNLPRLSHPTSASLSPRMAINRGDQANSRSDNFALYELIATSGDISNHEYEKLRGYLAWHSGYASTLPSDHPYKHAYPIQIINSGVTTPTYRVDVTNACNANNPVQSATATITTGSCTNAIIADGGDPSDATVCANQTTSFSVIAQNATTYQWAYSSDGGTTYSNITAAAIGAHSTRYSGFTSSELVLTAVDANNSGWLYRCTVTPGVSVVSSGAELTVTSSTISFGVVSPAPSLCSGNSIALSATVTNTPALAQGTTLPYDFLWLKDGIPVRVASSSNTTDYLIEDNLTSGASYTIRATNPCNSINRGITVAVTANLPSITAQPTDLNLCSTDANNSSGNFSVTASNATSYQWSFLQPTAAATWQVATATVDGTVAGVTTSQLTLTNPTALSYQNYQYRCAVANGCGSIQSLPAAVTIASAIPALVQNPPASLDLCLGIGGSLSIQENNGLSYQWEKRGPADAVFSDVVDTIGVISGGKTSTLTFHGGSRSTALVNGFRYQVTVSNGCGNLATQGPFLVNIENNRPVANALAGQPDLCTGTMTQPISFTGTPAAGVTYFWANDDIIGTNLLPRGDGNILPFEATNYGTDPVIDRVTVFPAVPGCVGADQSFNIVINPKPTLQITGGGQEYCHTSRIRLEINNGPARVRATRYTWTVNDPTIIPNGVDGSVGLTGSPIFIRDSVVNTTTSPVTLTYTFTPNSDNSVCTGDPKSVSVKVKPIPSVNNIPNQDNLCHGYSTRAITFTGNNVDNTVYNWTNNNVNIGLPGSGNGNIAAFEIDNVTAIPISASITVTPSAAGCTGTSKMFSFVTHPIPTGLLTQYENNICSGETPDIKLSDGPRSVLDRAGGTQITQFEWTVTLPRGITNLTPAGGTLNNTMGVADLVDRLTSVSNQIETIVYLITPITSTCRASTPIRLSIKVNPDPNVATTASDLDVCSNNQTNIRLSSPRQVENTFYTWRPTTTPTYGATIQARSVPGPIRQRLALPDGTLQSKSVDYRITPTANGCNGNPITITVNVHPLPAVTAFVNAGTLCSGQASRISLVSSITPSQFTWNVATVGVSGAQEETTGSPGPITTTLTNSSSFDGTVTYSIRAVTDKTCVNPDPKVVTLKVVNGPVIHNNLNTTVNFCDDDLFQLTLGASSETLPFSYQWEVATTGANWAPLTEVSPYSGTRTRTLSITSIPNSFSNHKYRARLTDNTCPDVLSNEASLTSFFVGSSVRADKTAINYGDKVRFEFVNPPARTTFLWNFGDTWTSSEQNPIHYFYPHQSTGNTFTVSVVASTNEYSCRKTFTLPVITMTRRDLEGTIITGDGSADPTDFLVSPIPFKDQLHVYSKTKMQQIRLTNGQGRAMIFQSIPHQNNWELNGSTLPPGFYLLTIWHSEGIEQIKVIRK